MKFCPVIATFHSGEGTDRVARIAVIADQPWGVSVDKLHTMTSEGAIVDFIQQIRMSAFFINSDEVQNLATGLNSSVNSHSRYERGSM